MTISSESRKAGPFTGNGSTTIFPFTFKVFQASDLLVVKWPTATEVETTLVLNTDYTVQMNANQDASPGGTITLPVALPSTHKMVITTALQYLQSVEIANHGGFYPSVLNAALDRITIFAQQLKEKIDRAVVVPLASPNTPSDYMNSIATQVTAATTQAGIATTQAGNAATSASNAANSATLALNSTPIGTLSSVAGVDTITAAASPTLTQQAPLNSLWNIPAAGANTGAVTLNIDGQGAVAVVRPGGAALQANDIPAAGYVMLVEKRASTFVLLNPQIVKNNASDSELLVNGQTALQFNTGGTQGRIPSVTCTQGSGALTFGLNPCVLDFRQTTLTTGVTVPRLVNSALSLVLPSGGTLGAVTTVSARLIVVAIDNAGTVELAVVNIAGGNDLSETGVINTTAISAASTANNVFYSTNARTNVAYRVVGAVDAVNTAGAWGNPTLVQPAGGNALMSMGSIGYGQTWQDVTGSRALSTTYYNTTAKPIQLAISLTSAVYIVPTIGGVSLGNQAWKTSVIVPPGMSYSMASAGGISSWAELR